MYWWIYFVGLVLFWLLFFGYLTSMDEVKRRKPDTSVNAVAAFVLSLVWPLVIVLAILGKLFRWLTS